MKRSGQDWWGIALAALSGAAIVIALTMVFVYAPREATMGDVQRIFYFHVSSAWVGFLAFLSPSWRELVIWLGESDGGILWPCRR